MPQFGRDSWAFEHEKFVSHSLHSGILWPHDLHLFLLLIVPVKLSTDFLEKPLVYTLSSLAVERVVFLTVVVRNKSGSGKRGTCTACDSPPPHVKGHTRLTTLVSVE